MIRHVMFLLLPTIMTAAAGSAGSRTRQGDMQRSCLLVVGIMLLSLWVSPGWAWSFGSEQDAARMAERAVQHYLSKGQERAFQSFNQGQDGFRDRDLYVFVLDSLGTCLAHGSNRAMIGRNVRDLVDADGQAFIQQVIQIRKPEWVHYKWRNPQTHLILSKKSYIIPHQGLFFGVGTYQPGDP